jgi:hypothetical protein
VTSRPDTEGRAWELRFHAQRNYPHRLTEIALTPLTPGDTERLTGNPFTSGTCRSGWPGRSSSGPRGTRSFWRRSSGR